MTRSERSPKNDYHTKDYGIPSGKPNFKKCLKQNRIGNTKMWENSTMIASVTSSMMVWKATGRTLKDFTMSLREAPDFKLKVKNYA